MIMAIPKFDQIGRSEAVASTANWAYNQSGYSYNQASLEYGGGDIIQGVGPQMMDIDNRVPQNLEVISE